MANRYPPKTLQLPLAAETTFTENQNGAPPDGYEINCNAGAYTLVLQSPASRGRRYVCNTGTSNSLTVQTSGTSATIDGTTSITLHPGDSPTLLANGLSGSSAAWRVVGDNIGDAAGVTPGTAAANKAVVLGATKNIATITS